MKPIMYGNNIQDYLISVRCSCMDLDDNTTAYFYNTTNPVQHGDTSDQVSIEIYSGQAWKGKANDSGIDAKTNLSISLPFGCIESQSQTVVTYTVQDKDTLLSIASLLSSDVTGIQSLNPEMFATRRDTQTDSYNLSRWYIIGCDITFNSERPVLFSPEEIEEATSFFNESRKIGEGGYGSVYFGILGGKEVAIKKMRSNKSKEFFAELKVLCKIHHINVVELQGYASGEDDLYLVYEYVQNGSLNAHLHDPLLKGHRPLSRTARTQIALDAAKGIEYIHDHTKSRYVHPDIKTSNILLDEGLRAKVADFGLVKLVARTNEGDFLATRLVGTPGDLPPESVKELQINNVFQDEHPVGALEAVIDGNLRGIYPFEHVYKMAEIAQCCLSEDAVDRPEMREIVVII
ncbi:hypothetical protein ACJW30_03G144800 [Castanea mollissima]